MRAPRPLLAHTHLDRCVHACACLRRQFDRNGDGYLNVDEFIVAMGVVSDAHDADGDGVADMKQGGGEYDGKEEEFAEKLALGENLTVAGMEHGRMSEMANDARKLQGI